MDVTILVDTNVILTKADQVSKAISSMEKAFQELQKIVAGTNGYWTGEAANHHRSMFEDEKDNMAKILRRLKEHPSDLKQIATGYAETEKELVTENQQLRNDYI